MERKSIVIKPKAIIASRRPSCRCMVFTCKSCKYKKDCLCLTRKYVRINIPPYPVWERIYSQVNAAKQQKKDVYIITNKTLTDEFVWDASYSSHNILQLNVSVDKDSGEWVAPMIRLAERCGICVNLVLHSIIPVVLPTEKLFSLLESVRACTNYRLILNFSRFRISGNPPKVDALTVQHKKIPIRDLQFSWEEIWKCSDEYKEHIIDLVKFYLGVNQVTIIMCGR